MKITRETQWLTQQNSQRISKDYYNNDNPTDLATQNTDSGSYETHTLPKLNHRVAENLTRPVTNNEIEFHTSTGLILTLFNFFEHSSTCTL